MMSMTEAMRNIHFPESAAKLRDAQLRLKFDELFFIQLNILRTASVRKLKLKGSFSLRSAIISIRSIKSIFLLS